MYIHLNVQKLINLVIFKLVSGAINQLQNTFYGTRNMLKYHKMARLNYYMWYIYHRYLLNYLKSEH